jgi:hypothetical protein
MCVSTVNEMSRFTGFRISVFVSEKSMGNCFTHSCPFSMIVGRNSFGKGIAHFQFTIGNFVHPGL